MDIRDFHVCINYGTFVIVDAYTTRHPNIK